MKALLFPGQGSQFVGMGRDLFKNYNLVKKIFKQADEKLNFKLSQIILEGPENELKLTQNTQPAILTISYSIFKLIFSIASSRGLNLLQSNSNSYSIIILREIFIKYGAYY